MPTGYTRLQVQRAVAVLMQHRPGISTRAMSDLIGVNEGAIKRARIALRKAA